MMIERREGGKKDILPMCVYSICEVVNMSFNSVFVKWMEKGWIEKKRRRKEGKEEEKEGGREEWRKREGRRKKRKKGGGRGEGGREKGGGGGEGRSLNS